MFKDKTCEVFYTNDIKLMSIKMKGKSLSVNLRTNLAYSSIVNSGQIWHKRKHSRKPVVENHGKPVVKNHGLDSRDFVKVSKELIVKEIKGLDVVREIIEQEGSNKNVDDHLVRGTRSLSDIYQRCNINVFEPADHEETLNHLKWKNDKEEELYMIEKNNTLVDIPPNRKVQKDGAVNLVYYKTENQIADLFTKPLSVSKFEFIRQKIGVCSYKIKEECWKFAFETAH